MAGAGWDEFKIEENSVLPSSRYLFARVGPVLPVRVCARSIFAHRAGFRYPFFLGDLVVYGRDSTAIGFDATLTLGGRIEKGFSWELRSGFDLYSLTFKGQASTTHIAARPAKTEKISASPRWRWSVGLF
ncbi:MAG: hypothetical protein R3A47_03960 [Polyangiales bacterium]